MEREIGYRDQPLSSFEDFSTLVPKRKETVE